MENKANRRELMVCPHCGSKNIEMKVWIDPNEGLIKDAVEPPEVYCYDCNENYDRVDEIIVYDETG